MGCFHKRRSAKECFEKKFRVTPGCWIWTGALGRKDYGLFGTNGKTMRAHRLSYIFYIGEIPDGLFVCHKCDNPRCVNPDHLFLGTCLDNNRDMRTKGRDKPRQGTENWKAKLTNEQVIAIFYDPRKQAEIAAEYGVAVTKVSAIKTKACWKHVVGNLDNPGRWSICGDKNHRAKLTDGAVRSILLDRRPHAAIAAEHGIGAPHVSAIKSGKTWRHVFASVMNCE